MCCSVLQCVAVCCSVFMNHELHMSLMKGVVTHVRVRQSSYGVATVSRIDKIIGLFCKISSLL